MQTNKLMIDLETLSTASDGAVVAIGAAVFNDETVIDTAYWPIDLNNLTGRIEGKTLDWWFKQSPEAQQVTFGGNRVRPWLAGNELLDLIQRHQVLDIEGGGTIWANDPDFDLVMLKNWWVRSSQPFIDAQTGQHEPVLTRVWPFKYNVGRSYRTLRETAAILGWTDEMNGSARGTWLAHSAVEDAAAQARAVIAMRQFIANHIRQRL